MGTIGLAVLGTGFIGETHAWTIIRFVSQYLRQIYSRES